MKVKRIKPAKQGKTYKKGDQCIQNPASRKHRDNVKKHVISQRRTGGGLTVEALGKHQEALDDEISLTGLTISDESAVSGKSKAFSIGGLTDCSNISFYNVLNKWSSTNSLDQEKCAILAAVTDVIRSKGGSETETEYFAALMTALDGRRDDENVDFITAITFLLSLVIKKVPPEVLKAKFSETSKIFVSLLQKHYEEGRASMLMALLQCLSATLMAQEHAVWSESSTQHTFQILLMFTTHSKPKVRKLAQSSVQSLIKLNMLNHKKHPVGSATTKFAVQMMAKHGTDSTSIPHHILNLLKQCLQYFNGQNLKELCETILSLLSSNDHIMKTNTMGTLAAMFNANPPEENLSVELNMKLIAVLYEFQPSVNDISLASSWLSLMLAGHSNLSLICEKSCLKILPLFFERSMKSLLSESKEVVMATAETMRKVSEQCLESASQLIEEDIKSEDSSFIKIFKHIEAGLSYKYAPVWDVVLHALQYMYLAFGKSCSSVFKENVGSLIDLHGTPDFPFLPSLEKAVGAAIKTLGPEVVLKERPLNLIREDDICQFPTAWLLPIMKDYTEYTNLQFFISYFLPLAVQVRQKAIKYRESSQDLEAKVFETLLSQIWLLLPGFCTNPVDLKESFPNIAKILGTALNERKDLRPVVLQALRTLISKTIDEEELKCIGSFSKNYLPILFNLYTSEDKDCEALSLIILETIKVFLVITDGALISVFITKLLEKMKTETATNKQHQLMDLAVAMVRYSEGDLTNNLYIVSLEHLKDQDKGMQKKSYRILEELFDSNSESCKNLVQDKFEDVKSILLDSLSSAAPSSKAPRLRCLSLIVKKLDESNQDFLQTILPEVILCTKGVSVKARDAAFDLLVDIGSAFVYLSKLSKEECIENYFQIVMAGLAASPHMISATLLTFTKLVHEYRYCLSAKLISSVLESAIELLKSKNNEVIKASLLFVRAITKILDANELSGHLEVMVKNLFTWNINNRNTYRTQIRHILEKLERKCGYELILSLVPDQHKKLMVHIRKTRERNKRIKDLKKKEPDGDNEENMQKDSWEDILAESDDEEEFGNASQKGKMKKKKGKDGKSWIVEGDEAVDLLDPSAAKKVVATKPKQVKKLRKSEGFSMSSDGRFMINDGDEESEDRTEPLDVGEKDMLAGFEKTPKQLKLGKRKHLEEMPEEEEMKGYQPGGVGIHRKQDEPASKSRRYGEEYKAKKSDGDVKLKGKPDPYAYIPLNRQKLNKRKKAKLSGQFQGMVKAAKKGAHSGNSKHRKNVTKFSNNK